MKVFFTCSTSRLLENYDRYQMLCSHIKKLGHELTDDWLGKAYRNIQKGKFEDSNSLYERKIRAITDSSVIIAESSIKSFTVGHQITIGLNKAIPVLLLYKVGRKKQKSYIEGIKSSWLTKRSYETDEMAIKIIDEFLDTYSSKRKTYRFNLVINQEENRFLEKNMAKFDQSKTEVIRNLIEDAMKKLHQKLS
ncbi:MAG: hypothetical protein WC784_01945 [Candidatus Shapirobacteria bacterium]